MKKNLTLALPEDLLQKARILAVHEGTTVNEMVRVLLQDRVGRADHVAEAMEDLIRISARAGGKMGGRTWKREDIYDRKVFRAR